MRELFRLKNRSFWERNYLFSAWLMPDCGEVERAGW